MRTPREHTFSYQSVVQRIKIPLSYWPVFVLALSFVFSFKTLRLGLVPIVLSLTILLLLHARRLLAHKSYSINILDLIIACCLCVEFVSYSQSTFRFNSTGFLLVVVFAVLMYYFIRFTLTPVHIRVLIRVLCLVGLYYGLQTARHIISTSGFMTEHGFQDMALFRNLNAPLTSSNEWVLFLLLLLSFSVLLYLKSNKVLLRAIAAVSSLILMYGVIMSLSRGGYFALAAFVLVMLAGIYLFARRKWRTAWIGTSAAVVMLTLATVPHWHEVSTTLRMSVTESQQRSLESRWHMWEAGTQALQAAPVFGIGMGNFLLQYNVIHKPRPGEPPLTRATSTLALVLAESGIIGLIVLIIAIACLVLPGIRFLRQCDRPETDKLIIITSIAALTAVCIRELTLSTLLFRPFILCVFCFLAALSYVTSGASLRQYHVSRKIVLLLALPLVSLTTLVLWQQFSEARGARYQFETLLAMRNQQMDKALKFLKQEEKLLPDHPMILLHQASVLSECSANKNISWETVFSCGGNIEAAIELANRASLMEPRDETLNFALGWLLACDERWGEASGQVRRAFTVNPSQPLYPLTLGMISEKMQDMELAFQYYAQTLAIDPDLYLSQFYRELQNRHPETDSVLKASVLNDPDISESNPIALACAGALQFFFGNYALSEQNLNRAISILPGMNRPYYYLGAMALTRHDTATALELWDKSLALHPRDLYVNWQYGTLLQTMNDPRARDHLDLIEDTERGELFKNIRESFYPGFQVSSNITLSSACLAYFSPEVPRN